MSEDVTIRRPAEPSAGAPHTLESAANLPDVAAAAASAQPSTPPHSRPDGASRLVEPAGPADSAALVGPAEALLPGEAVDQPDVPSGSVAGPPAPGAADPTPNVAEPVPTAHATQVDRAESTVSAAVHRDAAEDETPAPTGVVSVEAASYPEAGDEVAGGEPVAADLVVDLADRATGTNTEDDPDSDSAPNTATATDTDTATSTDADTDGIGPEHLTLVGTGLANTYTVIAPGREVLAQDGALSGVEVTAPVDSEVTVDAEGAGTELSLRADETAASTRALNGSESTAAEPPGEAADAQATDSDDEAGMPDAGPDPDELRGAAEAVLLVVDTPLSVEDLARVLEVKAAQATEILAELRDAYDQRRCGFALREVAGGWRLYTREEYSRYVERYVLDGQQARLTQAALETLAVIAYRQPVTRSRIAAIRGVGVDGVMRTLLTRGLVEECGTDPDSGGNLYRTTPLFLEKLGLRSLEELPSLAPLLPEIDAVDDVATSA